MANLTRFFYPVIRLTRTKTLTAETAVHAEVYVFDGVNSNTTYDTANSWCITNASQITMLVCTL